MKTILAPVDFSAVTDRVCDTAVELAEAFDGRIILLHSVPTPVITSDYGPMIENISEIAAASERAATKQLGRLEAKLQKKAVTIEAVQFNGPPVSHILEHAEEFGADFIVMGSHGHTALYDLLVGSTANGVIKKASCPVIIVPPVREKKKAKAKGSRAKK